MPCDALFQRHSGNLVELLHALGSCEGATSPLSVGLTHHVGHPLQTERFELVLLEGLQPPCGFLRQTSLCACQVLAWHVSGCS